jgi:hypothetical protein
MYGEHESEVRLRIGLLEDLQKSTRKLVIYTLLVFVAKKLLLLVLYFATHTDSHLFCCWCLATQIDKEMLHMVLVLLCHSDPTPGDSRRWFAVEVEGLSSS